MNTEVTLDYRRVFYSSPPGRISSGEQKIFRAWDSHFKPHLPPPGVGPILDIGCGNGAFVRYLRRRGYSGVEGVDIDPGKIRQGREAGIDGLHHGDLKKWLPEHPGRYRAVTARDVLEHFRKEEIVALARSINRALKPKGRLILQTTNAQSPFALAIRYGDFTHETAFTSVSLATLLRKCGFARIRIFPVRPAAAYSFRALLRRTAWTALELVLRIYQVVETGNGSGIFTRNLIAVADK